MALIEYIEPINIGSFFMGIGGLILCCVVAYIFYRIYVKFAQIIDLSINKEAKYEIIEESYLDKIAQKRGIDLNKELIRKKMFEETKPKSMRKKLEEQIYEEMFGKEEKK